MISWQVTAVAVPTSQGGCGGGTRHGVQCRLRGLAVRDDMAGMWAVQGAGGTLARGRTVPSFGLFLTGKSALTSPVESPASCTLSLQKDPGEQNHP